MTIKIISEIKAFIIKASKNEALTLIKDTERKDFK